MNNIGVNSEVLNKWILDEFIGKGRYGVVYKAHNKANPIEVVAVKIISLPTDEHIKEFENAYGGNQEDMEAFFDDIGGKFVAEIESLQRLNHSNIVGYIDHGTKKIGMHWDIVIVMEYCKTLKQFISEAPLSLDAIINIGIDLSGALVQCQRQNIIHRDIKEDNIFKSRMGGFKIGDFGAANMATSSRARTQGVGTLYYMAPEVYSGAAYTNSVDIYSLGIVLYKLLNYNRFPYAPRTTESPNLRAQDNDAAFNQRMNGDPMPSPEFCPPLLDEIILRACAFNPQDRYKTADEFRQALINYKSSNQGILQSTINFPAIAVPKFQQTPHVQQQQQPQYQQQQYQQPQYQQPQYQQPQYQQPQYQQQYQQQYAPQQQTSPGPQYGPPLNNQYPGQNPMNMGTPGYPPPVYNAGPQKPGATVQIHNNQNSTAKMGGISNSSQNTGETSSVGINIGKQILGVTPTVDDSNEKTTDIIQKLIRDSGPNSSAARKIMAKTRELEEAQGKIRGIERLVKKKNILIVSACVLAVVLVGMGVMMALNSFTYRADKDRNYNIHKYWFGIDMGPIADTDVPASYLSYDDKWLYFSLHDKDWEDPEDHKLYRISKSGENMEMISDDHCEYNILLDDFIYYLNGKDNGTLYKIDKSGGRREQLIDIPFSKLQLVDGDKIVAENNQQKFIYEPSTGSTKLEDK